jgi:CHC2-type zinc finger protein/TOTE conflict system primase-like protein
VEQSLAVMREHQSIPKLDQAIASAFAATFIPRWDTYSMQIEDGSYRRAGHKDRVTGEFFPAPLTIKHVYDHFSGYITLSAYMLGEDNTTSKMCLDADDPDEWGGLITLASHLHLQNIPTYLELSSRGGHLWFFLEQSIPGRDVRRFGKELQKAFGLETTELFPKQDHLRTGPGSAVRLPFGIHRAHNHRYHFIHPSGEPLASSIHEQIALLAHPKRIPQAFFSGVLSHAPTLPPPPHFEKARRVTGDTQSERVKNAISVYDVVSQYIQLDRGGRGLCPFHDDHRESFSVNVQDNYWHCFACEIGGSIIDFYMKWHRVEYRDAVTELANLVL